MLQRSAGVFLAVALCVVGCIPALSAADSQQIRNNTGEEFRQYAQNAADQLLIDSDGALNPKKENGRRTAARGSFYTEYLVGYKPDHTTRKLDAFPIQEYIFDWRDQPTGQQTISYTKNTTVTWAHTGRPTERTAFDLVAQKAEFETDYPVSESATVGSAASTTVPYTLQHGYIYSITIYTHGVSTTGAWVYRWNDIDGNSGYRYEPVTVLLPLDLHAQATGIHFGPAVVIG